MLSQDIDISAIDEVLMVSGPGNFTALRTGLGYVRGLSLAYNVPSRSLSIFELDFALLKRTDRPFPEAIVRDAKAGRYYQAKISRDGELGEIALVQNIGDVVSFEDLQGIKRLEASPEQIDQALCLLAQTPSGETPAMANYIRPANADLPHDPPLQILPDHG